MKIETTTVIDGVEVVNSGEHLMGHRIFTRSKNEGYLTMYVVDSGGKVKSVITVMADCGQNEGYISDWKVKNL